MDRSLCKLTLIYPPGAENEIVDLMLSAEPALPGFTTFEAEGHGQDFSIASTKERVRGRIKQGVLVIVLPSAQLPQVLDAIREKAAVPHLMHWVEPVTSCGRLTSGPASSKSTTMETER